MFRTSVDEVHESGTAIELGKEDSSVGLGLRALDPLQTRPYTAILAAPLSQYSASIAAHPHFFLVKTQNKQTEK